MAALTADRITKMRAGGYSRTIICKMAASITIYGGSLVARNAAGFVVAASDAAAEFCIGVASEQKTNGVTAGATEISVITGVFKFLNSGTAPVVQANMHAPVFVEDSQTITTSAAANDCKAGILELIETDGVWVAISPEICRVA